jgi:hypothetical protein
LRAGLTSGTSHEAAAQSPRTGPQIGLEAWLRPTEVATSFDQCEAVAGGPQRAKWVTQAVLTDLGELDRSNDRGPAGSCGETGPCLCSLVPSLQPTQQMGPLDGDPVRRPGRGERFGPD